MTYNEWATKMFPSIISVRIAENSQEGKSAIFSLKDREFNITSITYDMLSIYNTIELYDDTLFFDRFYFIFKDTISEDMKVVSITNTYLLQYANHRINFNTFEKQIEIKDIKIRQQTS